MKVALNQVFPLAGLVFDLTEALYYIGQRVLFGRGAAAKVQVSDKVFSDDDTSRRAEP